MTHGDRLESTASLLQRARTGDARAWNELVKRFKPPLLRMAHGRLPRAARGLMDTDDIVQDTLSRAFKNLDRFEHRGEGGFLWWMRQILTNRVTDAGRAAASRPQADPLPEHLQDGTKSPLEELIGREWLETYDAALAQLSEDHRNAIILRFDFDYSNAELAAALGSPTPNAARMVVVRALLKLAELMTEIGGTDGGRKR